MKPCPKSINKDCYDYYIKDGVKYCRPYSVIDEVKVNDINYNCEGD